MTHRVELSIDACALIDLALHTQLAVDIDGLAACREIEGEERVKMHDSEGWQVGQRIATAERLIVVMDAALRVVVEF